MLIEHMCPARTASTMAPHLVGNTKRGTLPVLLDNLLMVEMIRSCHDEGLAGGKSAY